MTRSALGQVALCALLGASTALGLLGVIAGADLLGPVAMAAIGAGGVGALTWRVRSSATTAGVQLLVGVAAFLVAVASGTPGVLRDALTDGWSRLLTSVIPAPGDPVVLFVPFALVWVVTALGVALCARTGSPLLPVTPAAAAVVLTEVAGPSDGASPVVGPALVVVLGATLASMRAAAAVAPPGAPAPSSAAVRRRVRQAAPLVAAMAVTGIAVASVLVPSDVEPWRLRQAADEPLSEPDVLHPLAALAAHHRDRPDDAEDDRDAVVLRIELDRPAPSTTDSTGQEVLHIPMAAYDRYDGVTWQSSEPYRPIGETIPDELVVPPQRSTVTVEQTIEVVDLDGPWLPSLAGPRAVATDLQVRNDALAGTLAASTTPTPGSRYVVTSAVPVLDPATDPDTPPGPVPGPVDFTQLAERGSELEPDLGRVRQVAQQLFASPASYPDQLAALRDLFLNRRPDVARILSLPPDALERGPDLAFAWPEAASTTSPSSVVGVSEAVLNETPTGHGIGRINTFLYLPQADDQPALNAGLGTPEQFATAAALIARAQGIPARVVVGYTVPYDGGTALDVRRRDADAWIEVWSPDGGWHPLDPTPAPLTVAELEATTTTATTEVPPTSATTAPSLPPAAVTAEAPEAGRDATGLGRLVAAILAVVVALVVLAGGLAAAARWRRAGRARGTPAARLAGAWDEALHALRVAGVPVGTCESGAEVVAASAALGLPTEDLDALARIVLRGAHAPGEPTASDAGMAWHHVRRLHQAIRRSSSTRTRLRLRLDPRRPSHRVGPVPAPAPRRTAVAPTEDPRAAAGVERTQVPSLVAAPGGPTAASHADAARHG